MNEKDLPVLPDECLDPDEEASFLAAPVSPLTGKPEIDVSLLPSLPPSNSATWGHPRTGRWKAMGCGCSAMILIFIGITLYFGLKDTVWKTYEDVESRLQTEILVSVPAAERERLISNIKAFDHMLREQRDPYSLMGAFVRRGRMALDDLTVNAEEAEELNTFIEAALKSPDDLPP